MNQVSWSSPSNIAIVKYWGKYGNQLPMNPSISFTLHQSISNTNVQWEKSNNAHSIGVQFTFDGKENVAFAIRIDNFLQKIIPEYFPDINGYNLIIDSSNTFPHSSGIASSASAMSALSLCLCDMENKINNKEFNEHSFLKKASFISRLGSGSACRSVYPIMALWGKHDSIDHSSQEYAIGIKDQVAPIFKTYRDDILIISPNEKSVSSTAGHDLMNNNPFAKIRYQQAFDRTLQLWHALQEGDVLTFGKICEDEALALHALMMLSNPSYLLMEEGSLAVIKKVQSFRADTGIPIYFTLDAGPNVHLLYPEKYSDTISPWIDLELKKYCNNGIILQDFVGKGGKDLY